MATKLGPTSTNSTITGGTTAGANSLATPTMISPSFTSLASKIPYSNKIGLEVGLERIGGTILL